MLLCVLTLSAVRLNPFLRRFGTSSAKRNTEPVLWPTSSRKTSSREERAGIGGADFEMLPVDLKLCSAGINRFLLIISADALAAALEESIVFGDPPDALSPGSVFSDDRVDNKVLLAGFVITLSTKTFSN